jgi:hypothetical protein
MITKEDVYNAIKQICDNKKEKNIYPQVATSVELLNFFKENTYAELKKYLIILKKEHKIKVSRCINYTIFYICKK